MKISQEEFETIIKDILEGKITRIDAAKNSRMDPRTFNGRVQELSAYNPDLYIEYIKKFPYKQKQRDDIDYEALIIEMIVNSMTTEEAAIKYGLGVRTIQRRVTELSKINPDLIKIYKFVKAKNKNNTAIPPQISAKIQSLDQRDVKISDINETKKRQLLEIEKIFNERRKQYKTVKETAESMGMSPDRIYRAINELYALKIEEQYKEGKKEVGKEFREGLICEVAPLEGKSTSDFTEESKSEVQNNDIIY